MDAKELHVWSSVLNEVNDRYLIQYGHTTAQHSTTVCTATGHSDAMRN